jgi:hypothetical protein
MWMHKEIVDGSAEYTDILGSAENIRENFTSAVIFPLVLY